jgi:hypothetical protein
MARKMMNNKLIKIKNEEKTFGKDKLFFLTS